MSDKPLLYYFDGRGLGEIIRVTFCLGGVEFDERHVKTRAEFLKDCDDQFLLFRCLPHVTWGGFELGQSPAIVRHISRKTGLMGKDDEEAARIDMMYEGSRDFYKHFLYLGFVESEPLLKELKENVLPKFLPIFNKILEDNGSGYLVGEKPSLGDAGLLECLLATEDFIGEDVLQAHTQLQKFLKKMKSLPNIENYMKNIRKGPNSPEYVKHVREVLDWTTENKKR